MTRNGHEAEEVMQDPFLRLWERWSRVRDEPDPVGYLYRTAMNV
jgi:DNA-directed RNA polymerase specialized sigma24 family protein